MVNKIHNKTDMKIKLLVVVLSCSVLSACFQTEEPKQDAEGQKDMMHLLAVSGNRCAYPGCDAPVFDDDANRVVKCARIDRTSEKTYDNMILLCPDHYDYVRRSGLTTEELRQIKIDHERQFSYNEAARKEELRKALTEEALDFIALMKRYDEETEYPEFKYTIDDWDVSIEELIVDIEQSYRGLMRCVDSRDDWLSVNLGIPNHDTALFFEWKLLRIKLLERECLLCPDDEDKIDQLRWLREEFGKDYKDAFLAD